ncbi:unnamed protein product [Caenorhabditis sp. 36 PRJEB53466]|nr:unnamed protein product [Caenorhabditis sp. 36 PRJEB53466]
MRPPDPRAPDPRSRREMPPGSRRLRRRRRTPQAVVTLAKRERPTSFWLLRLADLCNLCVLRDAAGSEEPYSIRRHGKRERWIAKIVFVDEIQERHTHTHAAPPLSHLFETADAPEEQEEEEEEAKSKKKKKKKKRKEDDPVTYYHHS